MSLLLLLLLGCSPASVEVVEVVPIPLPTLLPALRKAVEPVEPQIGLVEMTWGPGHLRARALWTEAGAYGLVLGQQEGFRPDLRVELGAGCRLVSGEWDAVVQRLPRAFRAFDVLPGVPILLGLPPDGTLSEAEQIAAALRATGYATVLLVGPQWQAGDCDPALDREGLLAARTRFEAQDPATSSSGVFGSLPTTR